MLIFFDEIVFLTRDLCPINMRELSYVCFLQDLPDFEERIGLVEKLVAPFPMGGSDDYYGEYGMDICDTVQELVPVITGQSWHRSSGIQRIEVWDHVRIGRFNNVASADFPGSIRFDWATIEAFELFDAFHVTNSGNAKYHRILRSDVASGDRHRSLTEHLLVRHLPNYLTIDGPYHSCLEDLRNHKFISEMRSYLGEILANKQRVELERIALEIERLAHQHRNRVFDQYLSGASYWETSGRAIIKAITDYLLPGSGLVEDLVTIRLENKSRSALRWAGFVTDIPSIVSRSKV